MYLWRSSRFVKSYESSSKRRSQGLLLQSLSPLSVLGSNNQRTLLQERRVAVLKSSSVRQLAGQNCRLVQKPASTWKNYDLFQRNPYTISLKTSTKFSLLTVWSEGTLWLQVIPLSKKEIILSFLVDLPCLTSCASEKEIFGSYTLIYKQLETCECFCSAFAYFTAWQLPHCLHITTTICNLIDNRCDQCLAVYVQNVVTPICLGPKSQMVGRSAYQTCTNEVLKL